MDARKRLFLSGDMPVETDYQTYLDAIVSAGYQLPSGPMQIAQNKFVTDLKVAGLWSRMKTGYLMHSADKRVNLINLKNPSTYALTANISTVLDPLHVKGVGVRSGTYGYYRQPFKSNEYSGIENDLTIIQCMPIVNFANVATDNYSTFFRHHSSSTSVSALKPWQTGTNGTVARGGSNKNFTNSTIAGVYVATHSGTQVVIYKDGTKTTITETAIAPNIGTDRGILTANSATTNGGFTATGYFARYISADFLFNRFNDSDEATFRGIWNTYKAAVSIDNNFVTEYGSHCWFASEKTVHDPSTNKSWFGQCASGIGLSYRQTIFEVNHATGVFTKFQLGSAVEQDDHDEPSIIIRSSDNKLMCAYGEHVGPVIRMRVSSNAKDISAWGSETTIDPNVSADGYSYSSIFESATSGNIYIFYRRSLSGTNSWCYVKSTNNGSTFGSETQLTQTTYCRITQHRSNKDILHFITTQHPDQLANPDYVSTFKFDCSVDKPYTTSGTDISASMPLAQSSMTTIHTVTSPNNVWLEDIAMDLSGNPRVLFNIIIDNTTTQLIKDEYYSEWNGSAWTTPYKLHRAVANHYMETEIFATNLLSKTYSPLGTFDRGNPDRIISSMETPGKFGNVCELYALYRLSSSSFTRTQKTFDSTHDQWRPFTNGAATENVYWLEKHYYDHWLGEYFQILRKGSF